jgi:hypothetical protein
MKQYKTIKSWKHGHFGKKCVGFDKLDGSNIRAEWSRKRYKKGEGFNGWYKFGTRNQIIDETHEYFGNAVTIFVEKYAEDLARVFTNNKQYRNIQSFVVFGEYIGENSFAGLHVDAKEDMDIVLFDVAFHKKGIISPYEFLDNFGHLDIPDVIYDGNYNKQLVFDVRDGKYDLKEGIDCQRCYR